eukprot:2310285-Prorocentrum_lima.AAC.1
MPLTATWYKSPGKDKPEQIRIQTQAVAKGTNISVLVFPRSSGIMFLLDRAPFDARWTFYDIPQGLKDI